MSLEEFDEDEENENSDSNDEEEFDDNSEEDDENDSDEAEEDSDEAEKDFENMKISELKAVCEERGIDYKSFKKKDDYIEALNANEE